MKLSLAHSILTATATTLLLACTQAKAADSSFTPSLTVSEEYTDNVYASTNKRSDFITSILPGFAATYKAPLWDWSLGYSFAYHYYARNSETNDNNHNINATGLVKIIDEKLFLELSDVYTKVSLNNTRDTTGDSISNNQTDQNIGTVSPYLVLHPTTNLNFKAGYRYINTWYKDSGTVNKQDHQGFVNASYELSPKISITTDYTFTRELPERGSSFYRHELLAGPRYEYAEKSFIFAQGGFVDTDYDNGAHTHNPSWKAGINYTTDTFVAVATAGTSFADDPLGNSTLTTSYILSLTKNMKQGSVTLIGTYKEYEDGITEQTTNKSYSGGMKSSLDLTPDIKANLGFIYEKYHDLDPSSYTDKYFADTGISWLIGKDLNLSLNYKYIDYHSAETASDNYHINRVILAATKTF